VRQGFRGEVAEENGISAEGESDRDCHYRNVGRGFLECRDLTKRLVSPEGVVSRIDTLQQCFKKF
jgi:hypothetical protein